MTNYTNDQLRMIATDIARQSGELEHLEYNDRDEMNFLLEEMNIQPLDIVTKVHFGNCNWEHDWFRLDVYENLESISHEDYLQLMEDNSKEILACYYELLENGEIDELDF